MSAAVEDGSSPMSVQQQPHSQLSTSTSDMESSLMSAAVEADLVAIINMQHARVEEQRRALLARQRGGDPGHEATLPVSLPLSQQHVNRYESPLYSHSALPNYRNELVAHPGASRTLRSVDERDRQMPAHMIASNSQVHAGQSQRHGGLVSRAHEEPDEDEDEEVSSDIDGHEEKQLQRAQRALQAEMLTQMESKGRPSSPMFLRHDHNHHAQRHTTRDALETYGEDAHFFSDPHDVAGQYSMTHATLERRDERYRNAELDAGRAPSVHPFLSSSVVPAAAAAGGATMAAAGHSAAAQGVQALTSSDNDADVDDNNTAEAEAEAQASYHVFLREVRRQHREVLRRQQTGKTTGGGAGKEEKEKVDHEDGSNPADRAIPLTASPKTAKSKKGIPLDGAIGTPEGWHNRYRSPPLAALYHAHKYGLVVPPVHAEEQNSTAAQPPYCTPTSRARSRLTYEQHLAQLGLRTPSSVGAAASSDQGHSPYLPHDAYRHSTRKLLPRRDVSALVSVPTGAHDAEEVEDEEDVVGMPGACLTNVSPVEPFADVLLHDSLQASQGTSPQRLPQPSTRRPHAQAHPQFYVNPPIYLTTGDGGGGGAGGGGGHRAMGIAEAAEQKFSPSSLIPELGTTTPRSVPSASVTAGSRTQSQRHHVNTHVVHKGHPALASGAAEEDAPHDSAEKPQDAVADIAGHVTLLPPVELLTSSTVAALDDQPDVGGAWQRECGEALHEPALNTSHKRPPPPHHHHRRSEDQSRVTAAALRKTVEDFWKPARRPRPQQQQPPRTSQLHASTRFDRTPLATSSLESAAAAAGMRNSGGSRSWPTEKPYYCNSFIGAVLQDMRAEEREQRRRATAVAADHTHVVAEAMDCTGTAPHSSSSATAAAPIQGESKKVFYYYGKGFRAV